MRIVIIGGGASGLVTAIKAKNKTNEVIVIERNNKCGKKLLLTGNGRCNFWNSNMDIENYNSNNLDVLKVILDSKSKMVLPFFQELGVIYKNVNGYYYPYSMQATSIYNCLLTKCENIGVKFKYNTYVKNIVKEKQFLIETNTDSLWADKVVIATGSKALSKTGSDGNGYELAKNLGHTITNIYPSLVQVIGGDNYYKDWQGVRCEVTLSLFKAGKLIAKEQGELQCCDYGISGICTFQLSGLIASNNNLFLTINFVPWFKGDDKSFINWLKIQNDKLKNYTLTQILEGFLPYKIVNLICKKLKVGKEGYLKDVNLVLLEKLLRHFPFTPIGVKSFDDAQVCRGGVLLKEVNPSNMMSKKVSNLYFTGEVLDVDGKCGGYNLGFAFMSGLIAGEDCKND